jgi:hypothetical protein
MASYHFSHTRDSFISYENAPKTWKTDDGKNLPSKKFFINPHFNQKNYMFTGSILWESPVEDVVREDYTIVFSEDWQEIE